MIPRIQCLLICFALPFFSTCTVTPVDDSGKSSEFSLEQVARSRHEVQGEDLAGLETPLSVRVPIQSRLYPEVAFVHPDLSIALPALPVPLGQRRQALALGFGMGEPARFPDWNKVTRRLRRGYQPIVESKWTPGSISVQQTAFSYLPSDQTVITGREKLFVMVRMTLINTTDLPQDTVLMLSVGRARGSQVDDLAGRIYEAPDLRWKQGPFGIRHTGRSLLMQGKVLLSYRTMVPTPATLRFEKVHQGQLITNCLEFDVALEPREARTIDLVVAGSSKLFPMSERKRMETQSFETALKRTEDYWERLLEPGMKLTVPEKRLNKIYKALILSSLQNISRNPENLWHSPHHSPFCTGVWAWEFAHLAVGMSSIGFYEAIQPCLLFFTERQNGVGAHSANFGPRGDLNSIHGSYVGSSGFEWMSETGAVLWAMASHYLYSRNTEWLHQNSPGILAAWDWIQRERERTRVTKENGAKVRHYGLLPLGKGSDAVGEVYNYTFSDSFTWLGMSEMAKAFTEAGRPEAERLTREAEEYRQCILDVMRRVEHIDPDTGLLFVPDIVYPRAGRYRSSQWHGAGPIQFFATGLLDPADKRFEPMLEYLRITPEFGLLMGLAQRMGPDHWYINQVEKTYYKCYLARGEFEKALLTFYSNFTYGLSSDCYQTVERIRPLDGNFSPWQPNASGNGRMLEMLRRMVIDEQEAGKLWLLRGCPRRWFEPGKSIVVTDAPTLFGKMALRTQADNRKISVEIDAPERKSPKEMIVVMRHPERLAPSRCVVNQSDVRVFGETVIVPEPRGRLKVVCEY